MIGGLNLGEATEPMTDDGCWDKTSGQDSLQLTHYLLLLPRTYRDDRGGAGRHAEPAVLAEGFVDMGPLSSLATGS